MNDSTAAWSPEPHEVDEELTEEFQAAPYSDPWNSIMERISQADPDLLKKLSNWGIGEV